MEIRLNYAVTAIVELLAQRRPSSPTLLAIDGHSAAGKSSLARAIQEVHPASTVVQMDDFYRPLPERTRNGLSAVDGYQQYYDWQRLEAQVLHPLVAGHPARYQRYDWSTNDLAEWSTVLPTGLVIIEGCYAARPELRGYYQAIVVVVAPEATRQQRQRLRADATQEWLDRWDAAERYYIDHTALLTDADLIVPGE